MDLYHPLKPKAFLSLSLSQSEGQARATSYPGLARAVEQTLFLVPNCHTHTQAQASPLPSTTNGLSLSLSHGLSLSLSQVLRRFILAVCPLRAVTRRPPQKKNNIAQRAPN